MVFARAALQAAAIGYEATQRVDNTPVTWHDARARLGAPGSAKEVQMKRRRIPCTKNLRMCASCPQFIEDNKLALRFLKHLEQCPYCCDTFTAAIRFETRMLEPLRCKLENDRSSPIQAVLQKTPRLRTPRQRQRSALTHWFQGPVGSR